MAEKYYIGKAHWKSVLNTWMEKYNVIAPQKEHGSLFMVPVTAENSQTIVYDEVRTVEPVKHFFVPPLTDVTKTVQSGGKPWLFLGVKACGISALTILDQAFGGDFSDPRYQTLREESLIVSTDCAHPLETCFCTKVGGNPFPVKGFDLNLSKVWDGFVVEVGSLRGKELLDGHDRSLKEVVKEEAEALDKIRARAVRELKDYNRAFEFSAESGEALFTRYGSDVWKKDSENCVECGACTHVCPTCHCYFLDDVTKKEFVKLRGWDSCQYSGYAMTAGGGTPRPRLAERFRNRYLCKFRYLPENYGSLGCTGCGRCIAACQGHIDMRETLHDLK